MSSHQDSSQITKLCKIFGNFAGHSVYACTVEKNRKIYLDPGTFASSQQNFSTATAFRYYEYYVSGHFLRRH